MPEFCYYYLFPLESDDYHYIWGRDGMMVFEYDVEPAENMRKVVNLLNGGAGTALPDVRLEYPDITVAGQTLMTARGLEQLTYRKGLPEIQAEKIQKDFLEYCVKRLSGNY